MAKLWKKNELQNIIKDAENIKIKNNYIIEIGSKIKKTSIITVHGLLKLSNKSFNNF